MENKKLLKFLLKDLGELEELLMEKSNGNLDDLEMEFLQTRIGGAKRMVQILSDREVTVSNNNETGNAPETAIGKVEDKQDEGVNKIENVREPAAVEEIVDIQVEEKEGETETIPREKAGGNEVVLDEEKDDDEANHRLGDSFTKEKSVNDLIDTENSNLEHKLSNLPVESIKTAIGINDKFQYIRELFEGNADIFNKAVAELDMKNNIDEAVDYLKHNFKWKKNETSLKFVNLVKRRFSHE